MLERMLENRPPYCSNFALLPLILFRSHLLLLYVL